MDKKAQAEVITVVLIILLVLAAIVIVWQVIRSTVQESAEEVAGGTECVTMDLTFSAVSSGDQNITVKRGVGAASLNKIRVIVGGTAQTSDYDASGLDELETAIVTLTTPAVTGQEIQIAGILENGKLCDIAATRTVVA